MLQLPFTRSKAKTTCYSRLQQVTSTPTKLISGFYRLLFPQKVRTNLRAIVLRPSRREDSWTRAEVPFRVRAFCANQHVCKAAKHARINPSCSNFVFAYKCTDDANHETEQSRSEEHGTKSIERVLDHSPRANVRQTVRVHFHRCLCQHDCNRIVQHWLAAKRNRLLQG